VVRSTVNPANANAGFGVNEVGQVSRASRPAPVRKRSENVSGTYCGMAHGHALDTTIRIGAELRKGS
jgi:hypothetical protein